MGGEGERDREREREERKEGERPWTSRYNSCRSGRLVFMEEAESDDELMATPTNRGGYTHLDLDQPEDNSRDRSQSAGSEQIGRFEVRTTECRCCF